MFYHAINITSFETFTDTKPLESKPFSRIFRYANYLIMVKFQNYSKIKIL
jgi:hypothetical protein